MDDATRTPELCPVGQRGVRCGCFTCRKARKAGAEYPTQPTDERFPLPDGSIYVWGGRTGTNIHQGRPGSSVLGCGRWVKHNLHHFQVDMDPARPHPDSLFCERCWPRAGR